MLALRSYWPIAWSYTNRTRVASHCLRHSWSNLVIPITLGERSYDLVLGGTNNHLVLINLKNKEIDGSRVEWVIELVHISANKSTILEDVFALVLEGICMGMLALTSWCCWVVGVPTGGASIDLGEEGRLTSGLWDWRTAKVVGKCSRKMHGTSLVKGIAHKSFLLAPWLSSIQSSLTCK